MIDRTAALASAALRTYGLPALGSRYSGRRNGPTASSRIMTGTLIKNNAPHEKYCRIARPSTGNPHERARDDQHGGTARECREDRRGPEKDGADQEQAPATDAVAQRAHR